VAIEVFGVEHIDLTVSDFHRSTAFYEKIFGALGFKRVSPKMSGGTVWTNGYLIPTSKARPFTGHRRCIA